jgi:hypothetical protein
LREEFGMRKFKNYRRDRRKRAYHDIVKRLEADLGDLPEKYLEHLRESLRKLYKDTFRDLRDVETRDDEVDDD